MPSPLTRSSTPRLSEVAREVRVPSGIVTTGWPAVRDRCRAFGVPFDEWQHGIGRITLGKRADGSYAASIGGVVISIPRQTGKTYLFGWMVFALCTIFPGLTVIWTAHRARTSNETFEKMRTMAGRKKVAPYIARVRSANGEQLIEFKNGSRILFGAREQGFGRGFDKVDVLVLDEAQILTEAAMTDMVPATNAAPNGLVLMMGTPPRPKDPGEVFTNRRKDALSGDEDTAFVEFSADRGAKVIDWDQLAKANPSYPHRTSRTAVLRMQKLLGSDINFYREAYGIWDDLDGGSRLIPADTWKALGVEQPIAGVPSFGVAFSGDGLRTSVAGAMKHEVGVHVELIGARSGAVEAGIEQLADWLEARWRKTAVIVISGRAGAALLHKALRDRGVPEKVLRVASTVDYTTACASLLKAVHDGTLSHLDHPGQAVLDESVAISDRKERGARGSGAWGWQATTADGDETPTEAISLALWGAVTSKRKPARRQEVI